MRTPKKRHASRTRTLTNSSRTTFIRCRRRYYYSYERQLSPKGVVIPFVVGGLFHKVMERWYTSARPSVTEGVRIVNEGMREARQEALGSANQLERLEVAHGMLIGIARAYHALYIKKDRAQWKVRGAEVGFSFPINSDWSGQGKIDLLVERGDGLYFVEHKTTSMLGEDYVGRLPLDDQIHQYWLGVSKALNVKPKGVIYNVVQKSRLRQKKGETFEAFCRRVEEDYLAEPARYFWRGVLRLPSWSIERYKDGLEQVALEIDAARAAPAGARDPLKPWYMNTHHCFQFGACPFVPLCTTNESKESLVLFSRRDNPHPELEDADGEAWL